MSYLYSAKEIFAIEKNSCEAKGINLTELMYRAGYVLIKDFLKRVNPSLSDEILVVANSGNNGGDAIVMYQELKKMGYRCKLFVFGNTSKTSEAFSFYFDKLNGDFSSDFSDFKDIIKNSSYLIDGIFGIGLDRNVSGVYQEIIEAINYSTAIVYSIDIPSGIHPDNGQVMAKAINAHYTGVLGNYKYGNFLNDALDYHGEIALLDFGMIESKSQVAYLDYQEIDFNIVRKHNSYKYTYHKIAYIGSEGMPGAINLSAMAGLRSGVGLSVVFYEKDGVVIYPEIIYQNLNNSFSVDKYDAFVFGPGMIETTDLFQRIFDDIISSKKPAVIDAGGLKYLNLKKKYENIIITPHIKELSDILEVETFEISKDPFLYINKLTKIGITVLLKGVATIISDNNKSFVLQAKNPGLATAGTGDVLAGMISAFINENTLLDAALKGFALHSTAAYFAREEFTETAMIASDLIRKIPLAFKEVVK